MTRAKRLWWIGPTGERRARMRLACWASTVSHARCVQTTVLPSTLTLPPLTCTVALQSAYSAVEGQQSVSAADACPVACNRCASAADSVLEVKAGLAGGDYRLTPALSAVDLSAMPEGSTAPALWIYAVDGAGIVLVPNTTYTATPAQPLPFSLIAPRTREQQIPV